MQVRFTDSHWRAIHPDALQRVSRVVRANIRQPLDRSGVLRALVPLLAKKVILCVVFMFTMFTMFTAGRGQIDRHARFCQYLPLNMFHRWRFWIFGNLSPTELTKFAGYLRGKAGGWTIHAVKRE